MISAPDAANVLVQHTGEQANEASSRSRCAHLDLSDRHHLTPTPAAPSTLNMLRKSINGAGGGLSLSS